MKKIVHDKIEIEKRTNFSPSYLEDLLGKLENEVKAFYKNHNGKNGSIRMGTSFEITKRDPRNHHKTTQKITGLSKEEFCSLLENYDAGQAVKEYAPTVETIVNSKCRDTRHIEHTLDGLLDFCFDSNALALYKKLCRYYYGIDPLAAASYVQFYREMWDSK